MCVCWNRNSMSSWVRRRRGGLRGPSPGVVKQSTEVKYSENFFKPVMWPHAHCPGSSAEPSLFSSHLPFLAPMLTAKKSERLIRYPVLDIYLLGLTFLYFTFLSFFTLLYFMCSFLNMINYYLVSFLFWTLSSYHCRIDQNGQDQ